MVSYDASFQGAHDDHRFQQVCFCIPLDSRNLKSSIEAMRELKKKEKRVKRVNRVQSDLKMCQKIYQLCIASFIESQFNVREICGTTQAFFIKK